MNKCDLPVPITKLKLTSTEANYLWSKDRVALLKCGEFKQALQDYYLNRDKALTE